MERCIQQIDNYYAQDSGVPFEVDDLRQDAIAMNLQRACELALDIANHLIKTKKLGLPQDSKESFALLQRGGIIDLRRMTKLQAMVGFRNVLVHEYTRLDLNILVAVIEVHSRELVAFANTALAADQQR